MDAAGRRHGPGPRLERQLEQARTERGAEVAGEIGFGLQRLLAPCERSVAGGLLPGALPAGERAPCVRSGIRAPRVREERVAERHAPRHLEARRVRSEERGERGAARLRGAHRRLDLCAHAGGHAPAHDDVAACHPELAQRPFAVRARTDPEERGVLREPEADHRIARAEAPREPLPIEDLLVERPRERAGHRAQGALERDRIGLGWERARDQRREAADPQEVEQRAPGASGRSCHEAPRVALSSAAMSRTARLGTPTLLLLALALGAGSGCEALRATRVGQPATLGEALQVYRNADEKKAIAIAVDEAGKRTWGAFYHARLQSFANEQALEECERNAAGNRIGAKCWVFAEGDEPAEDTATACRRGEPNAKRCALQDRFYQLYPR